MDRKTQRKTVIIIGLILVTLIAAIIIVAYFAFGANLQQVHIPDYVITARTGDHYSFTLDIDRLIWEQHLPSPPESELDQYPEIAAIRSLDLYVTATEDGYRIETISTSKDPDFNRYLRKAGIVLKDTQWNWTVNDIIASNATETTDGFIELSLPEYVGILRDASGNYTALLDSQRLLDDCHFELPSDPTQHSGYNAIMSLSIGCSALDGGYRLQAQSTVRTIMEDLSENHVRILNTVWNWTQEEMQQHLYSEYAQQEASGSDPQYCAIHSRRAR